MKTLCRACLITAILFPFTVYSQVLPGENPGLSMEIPPEYKNYASEGSYMNPSWVGEVPEWHYYDVFGNKLLDGFYLYGMSMNGTSESVESSVTLHPFLKKWLNGMVQVGDLSEDHGILAMIGDRVSTRFTPYTFNQSLFSGARVDGFMDFFHGMNSISIITSRISGTGFAGMVQDNGEIEAIADWIHGVHLRKKVEDIVEIGGTFMNLHHQDSIDGNSLDGTINLDSFPVSTPTALSIYGINGRLTLEKQKLTLFSEYARSQEVLGGEIKPDPGNLFTLNTRWDRINRLQLGAEGYLMQANYKTTFHCAVHPRGDNRGSAKYMYSLIEDNDDGDDYPENGSSKINAVPEGDPDGTIPVTFDRDKNGRFDYEEDFLNYDADPPKSALYFDKNNNSVPDVVEDDAYPDYTYVPSYYLPDERYLRFDEVAGQWVEDTSDGMVSKGLKGFHLNGTYQILPELDLTLGFVNEESDKESFQLAYQDTTPFEIYASEKATTIYSLIRYRKDFAGDRKLSIDNYLRYVKDNIPNHTQNFIYETLGMNNTAEYVTVPDQLDYRDAVVEMLIAEYSLYKNRGFSFTTRGKLELQSNIAHLDFNYPEEAIHSLFLVNKCKYIYLLPFKKDMFLIPKYKNLYEFSDYGPRSDLLDSRYRRHTMVNAGYLVYEWKMSQKTAVTMGLQGSAFNDFNNDNENYIHGNWTVQLLMKDRYSGLNMILTMGFSKYNYEYYNTDKDAVHNPLNNPHRITDDISSYDIFIKVHCGFL